VKCFFAFIRFDQSRCSCCTLRHPQVFKYYSTVRIQRVIDMTLCEQFVVCVSALIIVFWIDRTVRTIYIYVYRVHTSISEYCTVFRLVFHVEKTKRTLVKTSWTRRLVLLLFVLGLRRLRTVPHVILYARHDYFYKTESCPPWSVMITYLPKSFAAVLYGGSCIFFFFGFLPLFVSVWTITTVRSARSFAFFQSRNGNALGSLYYRLPACSVYYNT